MKDYAPEFEILRQADAADAREVVIRSVIVLAAAAVLWLATHSWLMPAWGLSYVALNYLYIRWLNRVVAPVSGRTYGIAMMFSAVVASFFSAMVIHIAFLQDGALVFLALCGVAGLALHALSRNSEWSPAGFIDAGAAMLAGFGVAWAALGYADTSVIKATIVVGTLAVAAYFVLSFFEVFDMRRKLSTAMEAEVQGQKLRVLGQLTSGIAHDFNNILTVVRGNLDLMEAVDDEAERRIFLKEATEATERAGGLVSQLLSYARKSQLRADRVALDTFLRERMVLLRRMVPTNVQLFVPDPLPQVAVMVDPVHLDSALLNAVINARDAQGSSGGTVMLRLSGPVDGLVGLVVEDEGPGMTEEVLSRATDPFFTTKGVGEGSGLGLSMIKGFAEQSGGRLEIENREGGGLRLTILLPQAE